MSTFQNVRKRLNGCRPFAWYLKRFKAVYEDAGLIPAEIFMIREEQSGMCLHFLGPAGTSGSGSEGVKLAPCDSNNHRFFWHLGNRNRRSKKCCSGLRAWNTDQCFQGGQGGGRAVTSICELSGANTAQGWSLTSDGQLQRGSSCIGSDGNVQQPGLKEAPCISFRNKGSAARFSKWGAKVPLETELYRKAQREHPEVFARLNAEMAVPQVNLPARCKERGRKCLKLFWSDGQCLDNEAQFVDPQGECGFFIYENQQMKQAESMACLDTWSDEFVNVVLKAAKLRVEAEVAVKEGLKPRERTLLEAEHEVEMLSFLLEENDSSEAEVLLEMEAQAHEATCPAVAHHLRAQISELQGRRPRSLSPPELTA
eukprot:s15_g45.t1